MVVNVVYCTAPMMALLLMVHVYGEDIQAEEASFTEI